MLSAIYDYNRAEFDKCGLTLIVEEKSLRIHLAANFSLDYLTQTLFKITILFNLCDSMFKNNFSTLALFSTKHFISLSSMYRRLNKLKLVLKEYHITINFSGPQHFNGSEKQIRHFMFDLYTFAFGVSDAYLATAPTYSSQTIQELEIPFLDSPFEIASKIKLVAFICLTRCKQGQYIGDELTDFEPYEPDLTHAQLKNYIVDILKPIRPKIPDIDSEVRFFSIYIRTLHVLPIEQFSHINSHLICFNTPQIDIANKWIDRLTQFFGIELSGQSYFFLLINLYNHYIRSDLLCNSSFHNLDSHTSTFFIEQKETYLYKKIAMFSASLAKEDIFSTSTIFDCFSYFLIREVLLASTKPVSVYIRTSSFHLQKRNIIAELKRHSQVPLEATEALTSETDLIITNFIPDLSHDELSQQPIPVVFIDLFPKTSQLNHISGMITKIYDQQFDN